MEKLRKIVVNRKLLATGAIAAGAFVALLAALFVGYSMGLSGGFYDAQRDGYAAQIEQETQSRIARCFAVAQPVSSARECTEAAVRASQDSQRDEQDLNAQRKMAEWAWWLLFATLAQIPLTALGILGLMITIFQGRKALAHAQNTSDAELRPWLQIEIQPGSFSITERNLTASFTAIVKNVGRTPAQNVRIGQGLILNGKSALSECARLFGLPSSVLAYGKTSRALLPEGVARISHRARMPRSAADAEANWVDSEGRIPNPIIFVVAYYDCPGHDEPSKTVMTFSLSRTISLLGPEGPRAVPGFFTLSDTHISATAIKHREFIFCEAT